MENSEQSAFAIQVEYDKREENGTWTKELYFHKGLTKREYFAGLAMQGIIMNREMNNEIERILESADRKEKVISIMALRYADALLSELQKPKP